VENQLASRREKNAEILRGRMRSGGGRKGRRSGGREDEQFLGRREEEREDDGDGREEGDEQKLSRMV
jgi:hypothetical protein